MPKISTYNTVTPQGTDKIIISQENGTPTNVTKNITVDALKEYIGTSDTSGIPTPYMYVLKTPGAGASVAIQKPVETDWLTKNPRLFMFRYTKAKPNYINNQDYVMGRGNFVHPSHNNGVYQKANFPGSNWASTQQDATYRNIYLGALFPIPTEWDINSELKIAKTGSVITDFASLRPTTYIEVPFNPLAFLFDGTNTEVTSLPATSSDYYWGTRLSVQGSNANINPDNNPNDLRTTQIIMKFAIGIPNPTWTNTNHELPYIFGDLSNAVMLKYRFNANDRTICTSYSITQGATGPSARGGG
jgi:hypothetical protein